MTHFKDDQFYGGDLSISDYTLPDLPAIQSLVMCIKDRNLAVIAQLDSIITLDQAQAERALEFLLRFLGNGE